MARTLYQLGEICADYVDSPADTEIIYYAVSGILEGIDNLNLRTWNFQLTISGFAMQVGVTDYVFGSDLRVPRHCALKNGSNRTPIGYVDPKSFFLESPDAGSGEPTSYTFLRGSNTIRFDAAPTADSLVTWPSGEIVYFARIQYPVVDTSGLGVPLEVEKMLLDYGRAHTAERYDSDKIVGPLQRFNAAFRQLRANESLDESQDWSE